MRLCRVDCVFPAAGNSFREQAVSVISGDGISGFSGSALYAAASLLNHSCQPNVDVSFPENNSKRSFLDTAFAL